MVQKENEEAARIGIDWTSPAVKGSAQGHVVSGEVNEAEPLHWSPLENATAV